MAGNSRSGPLEATDVLPAMDRRMGHIEESTPVLVEVQQHLSMLPEVMETIGRVADKLPGNRRSGG